MFWRSLDQNCDFLILCLASCIIYPDRGSAAPPPLQPQGMKSEYRPLSDPFSQQIIDHLREKILWKTEDALFNLDQRPGRLWTGSADGQSDTLAVWAGFIICAGNGSHVEAVKSRSIERLRTACKTDATPALAHGRQNAERLFNGSPGIRDSALITHQDSFPPSDLHQFI